MVTLDAIRDAEAANLYPRRVLAGRRDALVLFAAAFHGRQDAVWIADAGLDATCVDIDKAKLMQMADVYPDSWEYRADDVFEYATGSSRIWDVVSIDCPSNLFARCAELAPVWCLIARHAVVLGTGVGTEVDPPAGWEITETLARSAFQGGVYWTVLERC